MRIVFFGTSNVALPILEVLSRKHEIAAVVTMPGALVGRSQTLTESPVSVLAKEMKLNILKPRTVKNNTEFYQTLQNMNADLFVVVSYGQILPVEIINLPKYKTINVHFSLLPKYRGPSPIQTAILNGEIETGTSIFILDEQVDHGPILAQEKIEIDNDDNSITLSEKMAFKSAQLVIPTIDGYIAGSITPRVQDDLLATRTEHIDKAHGKIDWTRTALQIYNRFRAFFPWPGIWAKWNGKIVKIIDCAPSPNPSPSAFAEVSADRQGGGNSLASSSPLEGGGQVGVIKDGGVVVCGGSSFLQINRLQLEGKKETNIKDFLNGHEGFVGSKLNDKN